MSGTGNSRRIFFKQVVASSGALALGTGVIASPAAAAETSVVSPRPQHWDAQNLFVVGSSVYPHNAGYNPTGPLAALALRLGDDLGTYIERPRRLS